MADMSKIHSNDKNRNQRTGGGSDQSQFFSTILKFILITGSATLLVFTVNTLLSYSSSRFRSQLTQNLDVSPDMPSRRPKGEHDCSLPTTRYDTYTRNAACYPSSGGIWVAELGPLELQHLNINRFTSSERSWNQEDEDYFCSELRQFGGSWYSYSADHLWSGGECIELDELMPIFSIDRHIGFPENGGLLVLVPAKRDRSFLQGMTAVQNALTMEERCMALESLGAVFCEDITGCPLLDDLSKEPYQLAEEMGLEGPDDCINHCGFPIQYSSCYDIKRMDCAIEPTQ